MMRRREALTDTLILVVIKPLIIGPKLSEIAVVIPTIQKVRLNRNDISLDLLI